MTTTDTTCGSRGPHIGNEGVPVCVLPKLREGRHVPGDSWFTAIRDWSDHAFAGVPNADLLDKPKRGEGMTENVDTPVIETSCAEETIAALLGEVARQSPERALRILLEHLGMEEVRADSTVTQENDDDHLTETEKGEAVGALIVYREVAVYVRGVLSGMKHPLGADQLDPAR